MKSAERRTSAHIECAAPGTLGEAQHPEKRRKASDAGFTLVEIMVAGMVLTVGLSVLLAGMLATFNHSRVGESVIDAANASQNILEFVRSQGFGGDAMLAFDVNAAAGGTYTVDGMPNGSVTLFAIDSSGDRHELPTDVATFGEAVPDPVEILILVSSEPDGEGMKFFQSMYFDVE